MADVNIATSAEQPINRHAAVAGEEMHEGDPVGIDEHGHMVAADPENGIPALGVALTPATDLDKFTQEEVSLVVEANRSVVGEHRVTAVKYGVEVEDSSGEWNLTPGHPVYLAADGGFTQNVPEAPAEFVQVLGTALTPSRVALDVETGVDWI